MFGKLFRPVETQIITTNPMMRIGIRSGTAYFAMTASRQSDFTVCLIWFLIFGFVTQNSLSESVPLISITRKRFARLILIFFDFNGNILICCLLATENQTRPYHTSPCHAKKYNHAKWNFNSRSTYIHRTKPNPASPHRTLPHLTTPHKLFNPNQTPPCLTAPCLTPPNLI